MADKQLTESAWKAFAKGKNYKDSAFVKALSEVEKSEKGPADERVQRLEELERQAAALQKANKADKALAEYIGDLEKALERSMKDAERAAKEEVDRDEEAEEPALLTSKLIPLLRQVKKGVVMHAAVAVAGKQTAVMLAKREISTGRRKLLAEYLGSPGGIKYHKGQCSQAEGGAVLFAMETGGGGGLAKRLRQALLDQTGLRIKVKVRAADTGEEEEDGEADADEAKGREGTHAPEAADLLKGLYAERAQAIEPRVADALKKGAGDVGKIRAVNLFAGEKADGGDYTAALKALDQLEKLLPQEGQAPAAPGGPQTFKERAAAMAARVRQAEAAGMPEAQRLKQMLTSAIGAAARGEPGTASTLLDEIEERLDQALGSGTAGVQQAALWDARIDEAEQMLQRLLKSNAAEGAKAQAVMKLARDRAGAGEHAKALAALEQMKKMVAAADAAGGGSTAGEGGHKGIAKYRASLLQFNQARDAVKRQLGGLRKAIPAQLPDEDGLAEKLTQTLDEFAQSMQDAVDEAINKLDPNNPVPREVADRIAAFEDELAASALVKHVDGNPFGIQVSVGETLGKALKAVRESMPTPA
jgi:hypothetical protein